jgi:uncharacterized protein YndB with AHSA1/START domain
MTSTLDPILLSIETPAAPDVAWEAITNPDRIVEWFTSASALGRPGDPYRLDFGDSAVEGTVVSVDPGRSFSHTWSWDDRASDETVVTWTVEPMPGGGSRVLLEHAGWAAGSDETARNDHRGYWESYLEDLVALLAG